LQQLDEITTGLRRRLQAEDRAQDGESAVPLSTSSALMTVGTTLPSGTWDFSSTLRSSDHVTPHTLASTEGLAGAGDAVTELMRRTLESMGSHSSYSRDLSHTVPDEHYQASDDDTVDMGNFLRDDSANHSGNTHGDKPEEQNSETRASADVDHYTDSLKSAQVLLKQLNEMTASSSRPVAGSREVDSASDADFDEDVIQEDDTLASVWALRQSTRYDDADNESLDSAVLPDEHEESYVAPQALNDVGSNNNDDFSSSSHTAATDSGGCGDAGNLVELESERRPQQAAVGCSGESGNTWFIDTQDLRAIDNMVAGEIHRRIHEDADIERLDTEEAAKLIQEVHTPGRALLQSSPSSPVQFSPSSGTKRKSRSLRKTAVQRREQMYGEQYTSDSSDSESDAATSVRLRHRRPQNSHHAPRNHQSASNADSQAPINSVSYTVLDDQTKDVAGHNRETPVAENQESEDNIADEPQRASIDVVSAQSANHCSPSRNDGITVSDDETLNGHHSESAEEDLYPS